MQEGSPQQKGPESTRQADVGNSNNCTGSREGSREDKDAASLTTLHHRPRPVPFQLRLLVSEGEGKGSDTAPSRGRRAYCIHRGSIGRLDWEEGRLRKAGPGHPSRSPIQGQIQFTAPNHPISTPIPARAFPNTNARATLSNIPLPFRFVHPWMKGTGNREGWGTGRGKVPTSRRGQLGQGPCCRRRHTSALAAACQFAAKCSRETQVGNHTLKTDYLKIHRPLF